MKQIKQIRVIFLTKKILKIIPLLEKIPMNQRSARQHSLHHKSDRSHPRLRRTLLIHSKAQNQNRKNEACNRSVKAQVEPKVEFETFESVEDHGDAISEDHCSDPD
jgi:hypothetical protein